MSVTISATDHRRPHARARGLFEPIDLDTDDAAFVNWSNANARVMLNLLGLGSDTSDLEGEAPVADARRAILRARATLARRGPALARPDVIEHGRPRALPDGTVELHPLRLWSMGLDIEGMRARLDAFERAVNALAERGATHIAWA